MGLGLYLQGRYPAGQVDWLQRAEEWALANGEEVDLITEVGQNAESQPTLFLNLHPSAESVQIVQHKPGCIAVAAKTSATGPGYHIYLCELLQQLGKDLQVTWVEPDGESGDETGYFHHGNREAVEQEMLRWLQAMARFILENKDKNLAGFMIAMPSDHSYFQDNQQEILTQLGPRDLEWVAAVAQDPQRGRDIFPWWDLELDARYHRDRALCLMWRELRWRPPLHDEETDVLMEVAGLLETAYDLDETGLELPWAEWHDILNYLEDHDTEPKLVELIAKRAAQASGPRIGYRRGPVKATIVADWSMTIPGVFAERWDDDGKSWCAWDEERTIWFTSFSLGEEGQAPKPADECLKLMAIEGAGERLQHHDEHLIGEGLWGQTDEEGEKLWQLQAVTAAPGAAALITICVDDAQQKDWAIQAWHSVFRPVSEE